MTTLAIDRPKTQPIISATESIYEAGGPKNECPFFPPAEFAYSLRGAWKRMNLMRVSMHEVMEMMPDIPGIRLGIDQVGRTLRVLDPLDTEDGQPAYIKYLELQEQYPQHLSKMRPWPEKRIDNATETQLKTWLVWARRLVNEKMLSHVAGPKLAPLPELMTLPGRVRIGYGNEMIAFPIHLEDFDEFGRMKPEVLNQHGIKQPAAQQQLNAGGMSPDGLVAMLRAFGFQVIPPGQPAPAQAEPSPIGAQQASGQQAGGPQGTAHQPPAGQQHPGGQKPGGKNGGGK